MNPPLWQQNRRQARHPSSLSQISKNSLVVYLVGGIMVLMHRVLFFDGPSREGQHAWWCSSSQLIKEGSRFDQDQSWLPLLHDNVNAALHHFQCSIAIYINGHHEWRWWRWRHAICVGVWKQAVWKGGAFRRVHSCSAGSPRLSLSILAFFVVVVKGTFHCQNWHSGYRFRASSILAWHVSNPTITTLSRSMFLP